MGGEVGAGGSTELTNRMELLSDAARMAFETVSTETGYAFRISPSHHGPLLGRPWDSGKPRMKLRDTGAQRSHGDPPEVVVEIHCRREDLLIEDPEFTEGKFFWNNLSRNKQMAIEQHIRDELCRVGLECGDLAEPFARLVLADAVSRED